MYSKTSTTKSTNDYWDNADHSTEIMKSTEKPELEKLKIDKSKIEKSKIEKSEIEKSEIEKSEIEKSEIEKSEIEKSKIEKLQIKRLETEIRKADAILIGAGAGLSASAGFTYSGKRFEDNFPDFIEKYGFRDMYSAGFYPYKTLEEHWAYWSRYIYINRYQDAPKSVYHDLYHLVQHRDYFVLTTNVDHCFQKAGFDKHRLFYTQGDYGLWQCAKPCHHKTYDNETIVRKMVAEQENMRIPSRLVPHCPVCGAPMSMNLRSDHTFVEDSGWHEAAARYQDFVNCHRESRILYLELGVGGNTPGIIKYPFWQMTAENPNAVYACINYGEAVCPKEIKSQSICIDGDIGKVLKCL